MEVEQEIKELIKKEAIKANPQECCGLITQSGEGETKIWPSINSAPDPEKNFVIKLQDYLMAEQTGGEVVGVYHSHPKGDKAFSEADTVNAQKLELISVLYLLEKDQFHIFEPEIEEY